ncbi:S41 family peptidase [Candidatus Vallotia tarda]|uniref:Carboxy-terminal-processing protease n=1 Tax=Candidatus Vallotiella hemipterorum TaxID=1177213 RepID=A0A916JS78_9BURK|nr:S41 family peptidase [Candidatus Vallotia tarda]CAG7596268.1 Carboxy-terminal-processing protease [Candidatus Vallotia tarda]
MCKTLKNAGLIAAGLATGMFIMLQISVSAEIGTTALLPPDQFRLLTSVFKHIKNEYVEAVNDEKLCTAAMKGMVSSLDPHSSYLDKSDYQELQEQTKGLFIGLGIQISQEDGLVKVISTIEDTPAFRAGIRPGDLITQVNNKSIFGMTLDRVVKYMRGQPNSKVTLTFYRKSDARTFPITLARAIIKAQSVKAKTIQPGYVWVRITSFQERTAVDLAAKLIEIAHHKPRLNGLILDLRNNSGGLLRSAIGVASAFLMPNSVIVSTSGQMSDSKRIYYNTFENYRLSTCIYDPLKNIPSIYKTVPIVVLVNAYSASASEIVSGALQDHHRALIMGKTTFGKGSVQTVCPMTVGTALCLTTAYYYTPSGRSIQNKGISPDILVDQFKGGDLNDTLVMREIDYANHLSNKQDSSEITEQKKYKQNQLYQLRQLDLKKTREQYEKKLNNLSITFGEKDDFMLQQAMHQLKNEPVKVSYS